MPNVFGRVDTEPDITGYQSILNEEPSSSDALYGVRQQLDEAGIRAGVLVKQRRVYLMVLTPQVPLAKLYLQALAESEEAESAPKSHRGLN